jgi:D-inositol-3-phosphate glycosyltransferase
LIAGGPPAGQLDNDDDARRLRRLVDRLGLGGRVHLVGRVGHTDLPSLIRSASAVVNVPYYEPFGIVPLEAMACGVPVVVSAVGGLCESVVDGATGLHVAAGDPVELSEALRRLLDDDVLRRRLGRAGARRARDCYGWPDIAARTAHVYEELTGDPAAGHRRSTSDHALMTGSVVG